MLLDILDQSAKLIRDNWHTFVVGGVGSLSVIGILLYPIKEWLTQKTTQKIKLEYDKKLMAFEKDLESLKKKDEIKFDVLHKNRIEIINNLYSKLCEEQDLVFLLIMPSEIKPQDALSDRDLIREIYKRSRDFVLYLSQNSIYLPKIIVDRFAGVEYSLKSMVYSVFKDGSEENKKMLDSHYEQKLRRLFEDLKNEIRDLLGVEETDEETNHIKK